MASSKSTTHSTKAKATDRGARKAPVQTRTPQGGTMNETEIPSNYLAVI